MSTALLVLALWALVAIPLGMRIGRSIRFGMGETSAAELSTAMQSPAWTDNELPEHLAKQG